MSVAPESAPAPVPPAGDPNEAGSENPAWTDDRLAGDPHRDPEKADRVRRMFAAIARRYDLNNRLHSFGRDQAWRRRTVDLCAVGPDDRVLDVACGTGDLTEAFRARGPARVVGVDFTAEMLDIARAKAGETGRRHRPEAEYRLGDAMDLDVPDASFDVVSIAFGIRNVAEPDRAFAEFRRVLAPGGRLAILEFATPRNPLLRVGHDLWTKGIMPRTASLIAGDRAGAYRYLPRSVSTFLEPDQLAARVEAAGFAVLRQVPMTFGTVVATIARVRD